MRPLQLCSCSCNCRPPQTRSSTPKVLIQPSPGLKAGRLVASKPLSSWIPELNNWKVSPATNGPSPALVVTASMPSKLTPELTTWSLFWLLCNTAIIVVLPDASVRLLLMVNTLPAVLTAAPGARIPPADANYTNVVEWSEISKFQPARDDYGFTRLSGLDSRCQCRQCGGQCCLEIGWILIKITILAGRAGSGGGIGCPGVKIMHRIKIIPTGGTVRKTPRCLRREHCRKYFYAAVYWNKEPDKPDPRHPKRLKLSRLHPQPASNTAWFCCRV